MSDEQFLALVTADQPAAPAYFLHDAVLNRREHPVLDTSAAPMPLELEEVLERRRAGAAVLDAREPADFAAGHLVGSLNVPADGRFAETAGSVVQPDEEIVVIAPQDREEEIVIRLARIGFDRVTGYLREPEGEFLAAGDEVRPASRLTTAELARALDSETPPTVLDVRNPGETAVGGTVPGALTIPLAALPARLDEVPTGRPVVAYCAGGYRSSVAASLLRRAGHADVSDLLGGYGAWTLLNPQPV
jgi:rhodanese-related sulfurtransferase